MRRLCLIFKVYVVVFAAFVSLSYADLEKGKQLYDTICFTCHGVYLGGGIGPNLIDSYWKHGDSPEEVFKTISEGIYDSIWLLLKMFFQKRI